METTKKEIIKMLLGLNETKRYGIEEIDNKLNEYLKRYKLPDVTATLLKKDIIESLFDINQENDIDGITNYHLLLDQLLTINSNHPILHGEEPIDFGDFVYDIYCHYEDGIRLIRILKRFDREIDWYSKLLADMVLSEEQFNQAKSLLQSISEKIIQIDSNIETKRKKGITRKLKQ